jgi:hypothetical protein
LHPESKNPFGLKRFAHIVELDVNGGRGAASNLHFVATRVKVLDGTPGQVELREEFPPRPVHPDLLCGEYLRSER